MALAMSGAIPATCGVRMTLSNCQRGVIRWQRLGLENVERGAGDLSGRKSGARSFKRTMARGRC